MSILPSYAVGSKDWNEISLGPTEGQQKEMMVWKDQARPAGGSLPCVLTGHLLSDPALALAAQSP